MSEMTGERVVWRRRYAILSCSRCNRRTPTVSVYADPEYGDGWPLHRCGYEIRPFDVFQETSPVPKELL